ncbi:hypothetical protein Pth03_10670 [Planotetraspora thailandica]|uniref:Uncharacterized protein n=1 Tax=Planotetraspora thailandica TaxID=487172 RepID=A0A8J3UVE3_9ACTN|nr:hypothetical protein [Planotetraspora thailandica]GII52678.1 hypothetical protein Pth03_10670 [Planotetraspora thailandica]
MELDALERRIAELRAQVRAAKAAADHATVRLLRAELRKTERAWDDALDPEPEPAQAPSLSVREQVHQALTLLGVPTAGKMIVAVNEAFFAGRVTAGQLTSLRRDEEKSFRTSPYARPYYLCAALTSELLSPARGLLAVSTWPAQIRIIGPLSPRTDFLTSAIRIAEHIARLIHAGEDASLAAYRLLTGMAQNIPGAVDGFDRAEPAQVIAAAGAELTIHRESDMHERGQAAKRAEKQLDQVTRLFGAGLKTARTA